MEITQHIVNDVTVLTLKGRVVTEDRDVLGTAIDALVEQGRVKLILDLQDVTYVDSSGLGLLVSKYVTVHRRGGDVKLLHLTARSSHLLEVTHLTQVFESFDSEGDAVRAFETLAFQPHTV
jgi:anti-sigma B factor antagonist